MRAVVNWTSMGPVGVAARFGIWPPRHKGGEYSHSSPGDAFLSSPAWSPEGDQTGAGGGFLPPFVLPFPPFFHPLGPRPLRAGLTNFHKTENHIKLKNAGKTPALTQRALNPLVKEEF